MVIHLLVIQSLLLWHILVSITHFVHKWAVLFSPAYIVLSILLLGMLLFNVLPVIVHFSAHVEDMVLIYLVCKYMSAIVAISFCNVVTICCVFAAMWTNYFLTYMNWWYLNTYNWFSTMNRRRFLLFILSTTFMIVSGLGIGLWVTIIAMVLQKLNVGRIMYGGDGPALVLSNINGNKGTVRKERVCGKRSMSERGQENCAKNDLPPPPKRGRKSKSHDGHHCGPCTVWIQTGSEDKLKRYHIMSDRVRHPGDKAAEFTEYLNMGGLYNNISLREDSCLCSACYLDCTRKTGKPRWYVYSKNSELKHCVLCCDPSTCKCEEFLEWGPPNWFDRENIEHWWKYFTLNEYHVNKTCGSALCKKHYVLMRKEVQNRVCKVCKCGNTSSGKWVLGYFIPDNIRSLDDDINIAVKDWVCGKCNLSITNTKTSKPPKIRDTIITIAEEKLERYGACMIGELICKFKELIDTDDEYEIERESVLLRKYIKATLEAKGYRWFTLNKKGGSMLYKPSTFHESSLQSLYHILVKKGNNSSECNCIDKIRDMVK